MIKILLIFNNFSISEKDKLQNILNNNFDKEKYIFNIMNDIIDDYYYTNLKDIFNNFEYNNYITDNKLNINTLSNNCKKNILKHYFIKYCKKNIFMPKKNLDKLLNYDIYIFSNISNHLHTKSHYYDFIKKLISLKKKIAIVHMTTCFDYYCPSSYCNNNNLHSRLFMNFRIEDFVKDINLFLPNFHFNNLNPTISDSHYNEIFYKENPKFLLDPIIIIPNLLSKKDFFKYYNLNENTKLIVYYCGRSDEIFQNRPEHELNKRIKEALGDKYNIWEIYETNRQIIYNINKLNKILKSLGYTLMIKLHRDEDKHFLWGKTCFRDDINDKNLSPFANIECPIVKHEHYWELMEYSNFAITSSDSTINWILSDLKIPCIYFTSKYENKCWIKFLNEYQKTNIYNNLLYGNICYIEDVINDNKLLDDNMNFFIKNFIECVSYDKVNLFKLFNINKNDDNIIEKFNYILDILK